MAKQRLTELCKKYCQQLGVTTIPKLVWSNAEAQRLSSVLIPRGQGDTLGICYQHLNVIYLGLEKHLNIVEMEETLRHELIHYRFPELKHGKEFQYHIDSLALGETWTSFDRDACVEEYWNIHPQLIAQRKIEMLIKKYKAETVN